MADIQYKAKFDSDSTDQPENENLINVEFDKLNIDGSQNEQTKLINNKWKDLYSVLCKENKELKT